MEFSKSINLKDVASYLEGEVKEKSIRYIDLIIDKMTLENKRPSMPINDGMEMKYNSLKETFIGKTEQECQEIFSKLDEKDKKEFNIVSEKKLNEEALGNVKNKIRETEEALAIIIKLKEKADKLIKKLSHEKN
jgi:hypothetical protein